MRLSRNNARLGNSYKQVLNKIERLKEMILKLNDPLKSKLNLPEVSDSFLIKNRINERDENSPDVKQDHSNE